MSSAKYMGKVLIMAEQRSQASRSTVLGNISLYESTQYDNT